MALSRPQLDLSQADNRRMSFTPKWRKNWKLIQKLVDAGFSFSGTQKMKDLCRCFCCGVEIYRWDQEFAPWKIHALYSPDCQYLIDEKGKESVEKAREQVRRFYYGPQKKKSGKKTRSEGRSRRNRRRRCQS